MTLPDRSRRILGRDYAYFRAEYTSEDTGVTHHLGDYLLICHGDEWLFAYPHQQFELATQTEKIRNKGGSVVLRQFNPPLPNEKAIPMIEIDYDRWEEHCD